MLVRLSKNGFFRKFHNKNSQGGFLHNQISRFEYTLNEIGADFVESLSRTPQDVDKIVDEFSHIYNADKQTIKRDFLEFMKDLQSLDLVYLGEHTEELDQKERDCLLAFNQTSRSVIKNNIDERSTQSYERSEDSYILRDLQIEVTSRCNERCIHCYIPCSEKDEEHMISKEDCLKIIDQFSSMGGLLISFTGGEVLLHKEIIEIIEYARYKDLEVVLQSNLMSLTDNQVKSLKELNLARVQVSLYSMDPKIHDQITMIKGSFNKTLSAIEKLHNAKVPLWIAFPIMKANKNCYRDIRHYANAIGATLMVDLIIMARSDNSTDNLSHRLNLSEVGTVIQDMFSSDTSLIETDNTEKDNRNDEPLCGAGTSVLYIRSNGDVIPCVSWNSMKAGNIYETSLSQIWNHSSALKILRKTTLSDYKQCSKCKALEHCSICPARNSNESGGNMFEINKFFCDVAFLRKRIYEECRNNLLK